MEKKRILKQECKINTAEISMSRVLRIGEGISIRLKGKVGGELEILENILFGLIADTCVIPLFLTLRRECMPGCFHSFTHTTLGEVETMRYLINLIRITEH